MVSLPHGFSHASAAAVPGPNANAVTDEHLVDPLIGTAVLNGVPVTVEAVSLSTAASPRVSLGGE